MSQSLTEVLVENLRACPCCGAERQKNLGAPKVWIGTEHFEAVKDHLRLAKCGGCGLVFTNPRPAEELLINFYNRPGYECHEMHHDDAQAGDAHTRFEILERFCKKGAVLDFGCGAGQMLRTAKKRGWEYVAGVEPGAVARRNLRQEGFDVWTDLAEAHEFRGKLDAVTMIHVLEHLREPAKVLHGLHEMLRPEGILLIEVPNADSLRARIAGSVVSSFFPRESQRYQAFPIHLYHFNARQLIKFIEQHDFQVVELRTVGMGVEEFWAKPQQESKKPSEIAPAGSSSNLNSAPSRSSALQPLKRSIKTAMSNLRLGEHLLAVCKKDVR